MMVKISIIVPIYNVEKHLRKSIECIQEQTLEDIEIILVNDGSTDNSLNICKEYKKKDDRIKVIDKDNGGVSSARNAGLEIATGDCVGFSDPDDWIESNMYQNMHEKIEKTQSEICMCNYVKERNTKHTFISLNIEKDLLNKKDIIDQIIPGVISSKKLPNKLDYIMGSVWRLIIKRDFVNKYNFRFDEDCSFMEDALFCIQIFLKSERLCIERGYYYHYIYNSTSASNKYRKDMLEDEKKVFIDIEKQLDKKVLNQILQERMDLRYINLCKSLIANEVKENRGKTLKHTTIAIHDICNENRIKNILSTFDTTSYKYRNKVLLNKMEKADSFFLYLYYRLYFLIK